MGDINTLGGYTTRRWLDNVFHNGTVPNTGLAWEYVYGNYLSTGDGCHDRNDGPTSGTAAAVINPQFQPSNWGTAMPTNLQGLCANKIVNGTVTPVGTTPLVNNFASFMVTPGDMIDDRSVFAGLNSNFNTLMSWSGNVQLTDPASNYGANWEYADKQTIIQCVALNWALAHTTAVPSH
jgi:hypothetical protein